jgi:hypothetical protein
MAIWMSGMVRDSLHTLMITIGPAQQAWTAQMARHQCRIQRSPAVDGGRLAPILTDEDMHQAVARPAHPAVARSAGPADADRGHTGEAKLVGFSYTMVALYLGPAPVTYKP